jgi:tryptophanyl-tRNA synthetase
MSKSYNNTITLRDSEDEVSAKIRTMPTDPARMRRTDPGDPEKCPVWQWHLIYSDDARDPGSGRQKAGRLKRIGSEARAA